MLQECRETVSGGGSENVFKQQQKEIQMMEKEKGNSNGSMCKDSESK